MAGDEPMLLALLLYPSDPRDAWNHLVRASLAAALTALGIRHGGRPYGVGIWNTPFARARFGREAFEDLARKKAAAGPVDPALRALMENAERVYGAPVVINRDANNGKGTVNLRFYSDDDLIRILKIMGVDTDLG